MTTPAPAFDTQPDNTQSAALRLLTFGGYGQVRQKSTPAKALSPADAVRVVLNILGGAKAWEWERLKRISLAMKPHREFGQLGMEIPVDAPEAMRKLAMKAQANYLPLVVQTFSQVMTVQNYISGSTNETGGAWQYWQRNQMSARQQGLHESVLKFGASYLKCLPGTNGPVMKGVSPLDMTAVYDDPVNDPWPMFAMQLDRRRIYLYDSAFEYVLGMDNIPTSSFGYPYWQNVTNVAFIQANYHGAGVCPVVRYRDRMLLEGEEQYGIVEQLIDIQERINETNFGFLVAQYFSAFRQRYIMGWFPETEQEALKATAADVWLFKDADVKVGQFEETDPAFYKAGKLDALQDLAAIGQLPAQNLLGGDGISNISADALAALEEGKTRKADQITTSLGESHDQALRLCCHLDGDEEGASDFAAAVKWKDATARALSATVDALGKMGQMLGVPDELLWEDIPGWDNQKVDRAKSLREAANKDELEALLLQSAQAAPAVERGLQAAEAADPDAQAGQ